MKLHNVMIVMCVSCFLVFYCYFQGAKVNNLQLSNMVGNEVRALAMNYQCIITLTKLWL